MPDDKSKVGEPDRSRAAANQDYEVRYLAEKFGLSREQAQNLIARVGNDREKLDQAARNLNELWPPRSGTRDPISSQLVEFESAVRPCPKCRVAGDRVVLPRHGESATAPRHSFFLPAF